MLEQPTDLEQFHHLTELNFAMIRTKTGRGYYVNPYYIAAWSNVFMERLSSVKNMDEIFCPCTHEELKAFLMAVYPPQLRITGFAYSSRIVKIDYR
ncbi:unnamed protein product [Onchocerca flexuosa]|uniref:BTB domain-containing protein n=1 Tax=Onchocerca flexuosa TaxID=387005 RepID=A0A183HTB0_9BILA|nr:unnamed protein product [Onchocerca flexuosa]